MKKPHFTRDDARSVLLIVSGAAVAGAAVSFITYPNGIVSGGITGIAQILNTLTGLPVGVMTALMNVPLFVLAWKKFGLRFILGSLLGMLASSLFIDLFAGLHRALTQDLLLTAVYGGLLKGLGYGLIYTTGATAGGSDIAARMVRRRYPYINFGTISLVLDAAVVVIYALTVRKYDTAMYTVITMFVSSRVVNFLLYGAVNSSVCYIITIRPREIADAIGGQLRRGATLLKAEGAYTGEERNVVLCAIKKQQIAELKKIITAVDSRAFVIITESHEVFGKNFSSIYQSD